jgi:glycosyltransferase involved in cell wall biosynthesis
MAVAQHVGPRCDYYDFECTPGGSALIEEPRSDVVGRSGGSDSHRSMGKSTVKILFLARSLNVGGAQRQLCVLAKELKGRGCDVAVAVFYGDGTLQPELVHWGIRVIDLGKKHRWNVLSFVLRAVSTLRRERADVVYTFLCLPNILAVLAKPLLSASRIVWSVRASSIDPRRYDWTLALLLRLESVLSRFADLVICNSRVGMEHAAERGFPRTKMVVISNGIDTVRFRPDPAARRRLRREWGVGDDEALIGLIARLDPMKDHPTFLRAAAQMAAERADLRFVCVGDGPASYRHELAAQARRLGLEDRLIWAGSRDDMPAVYCALDVGCSSSAFGEGFSNAVAEAMATGVPCVVTDVGDSARIVGDTGRVVAAGDVAALQSALLETLARSRADASLAVRTRARIDGQFGPDVLVESTLRELGRVLGDVPASVACGNQTR